MTQSSIPASRPGAKNQAPDRIGSVSGYRWCDVGVEIEGDANGGMAQALGDDLGVYAFLQTGKVA